MPSLDKIVAAVNTSIQTGNFKTRRFQASKYYGIADPVKTTGEDSEKMEPMIIDDNGECTKVIYDDTQAFQIFHVVDDIEYEQADPNYGNAGETMQETAYMRLVFAGNRTRLKVRPEELIAAVILDIPKEFTPGDAQLLALNNVIIETGAVESDPYKVFGANWQGIKTFVKPATVMFSIKYKIITQFTKPCFVLCPPTN